MPPAEPDGVTDAYVCRLLPLTCLAPDIVQAILDGRRPEPMTPSVLTRAQPLEWKCQQRRLTGASIQGPCQLPPAVQPLSG